MNDVLFPEESGAVPKERPRGIWLALSGGGFRASLFHYGCLKRLHEVGLLPDVKFISATSGGSFTAALLACCYKPNDELDWEEFEKRFLEIVMRGILGPTYLIVAAYTFYVAAIIALLLTPLLPNRYTFVLFLIGLGIGLALHCALAFRLLREKAHKEFPDEELTRVHFPEKKNLPEGKKPPSLREEIANRFLSALFWPSASRWQTLNRRAFGGHPLFFLRRGPKIFITAVDLNTGREKIFSNNVIADLNKSGCCALWEQSVDGTSFGTERVPIALAVAASTAYPPLFRPVSVYTGEDPKRLIGCFVDGGVVDNLATNLPKNLSIYTNEKWSETGGAPCPETFTDAVGRVLIFDASAAIQRKDKESWSRIFSARRLLALILNDQNEELLTDLWNFDLHVGIKSNAVGLKTGFDEQAGSFLRHDKMDAYLARVRTNMDSFSATECAVIAYCGYRRANEWLEESEKSRARLCEFEDILPSYCGQWPTACDEVYKHLRYSHRIFRFRRSLGRRFRL